MTALSIQPTFPIFTDAAGEPLENGYIWIGTTNLDPQVNPINVYWDAALTQLAAQPIRTLNGYPANSGTPARLYVNSDYSIRVMNKNASVVYSAPAATERLNGSILTGLNAANVVYDPAGTVAVATTVQTKLRETVSVKDFGAVGDGVTDDTAAIQACLTANAAREIVFPLGGTFKVTSGLTVGAGTTLRMYGATINASSSAFIVFTLGSGCAVFGGTINGSGNGSFNINSRAIYAVGVNNSPSAPTYIVGPIVRDVTINNFGAYGVYVQYATTPTVQNCSINHIGYAGVMFLSCIDGSVDGNAIYDISPGTSSNAYGVSATRAVSALNDTTVNPRSKNCRITNNLIDGVTIWEGIDSHAADGLLISGNTVTNCQTGIACVSSHYGLDDDIASSGLVISNNKVTLTSGLGNGIVVVGATDGSGVLVDYSDTVSITGNNVIGGGVAASTINGGILVSVAKNVTISGNNVINSRVNGICIYTDVLGFSVNGNVIVDPWDNTASPNCIRHVSNNCIGSIQGNTFVRRNTGLGTNVAVSSVRFGATTGTNISVGKNSYSGITSSFLQFAGDTFTGIDVTQAASEKGQATVSITSGGGSALVDVTFNKVFPSSTPKINAFISSAINGGGKAPIFRITNLTNTGFRLIAYPYDNGTFTATGTVTVEWFATT